MQVKFNFSVPYVSEYQPQGLVYQYEVYQDYENALQKVIRDGIETVILDVPQDTSYEIFPAQDEYACWKGTVERPSGPTKRRSLFSHTQHHHRRLSLSSSSSSSSSSTLNQQQQQQKQYLGHNKNEDDRPQDYLGFVLPDVQAESDRWKYRGTKTITKQEVEVEVRVWEWDLTEGSDMDMKYVFYTNAGDNSPVALHMIGINLYTGGHKDNYVAEYYDFTEIKEDSFPDGTFEPPSDVVCTAVDPDLGRGGGVVSVSPLRRRHMVWNVLPNLHYGDRGYDVFVHTYGRRHASKKEYAVRHRHFSQNVEFIDRWKKSGSSERGGGGNHQVALNRFADWSREEYKTIVLGRRPNLHLKDGNGHNEQYVDFATVSNFTSIPHFLPAHVIWKGTPADSPVKDQAACGSCFVFSSTQPLESLAYRLTGEQTLLSEQQMMDCSWGEGNTGCNGGEQDQALAWVLKHGGVAAAADYPYRGVNDFCRHNITSKLQLHEESKMVVVQGGKQALKAALLSQGPMAVSIDADADSFRFYSGGLYDNPECATEAADLSHAVIVSGYGVDEESGKPFWLVKNEWSPYWGEEGYIRVAMEPNDCGVSTQPIYISHPSSSSSS